MTKCWRLKRPQAGFTMIEMLLTLMIVSLCTLLFSRIAHILASVEIKDSRSEDEIAVLQLQLLFAQGSNYSVNGSECYLRYHGEDIVFEWMDHRLVKRPGYEVILQDVDAIVFEESNRCVSLAWQRGNRYETNLLGCE